MGCKQFCQILDYNNRQNLEEDIIKLLLMQNKYEYQKLLKKEDYYQIIIAYSHKLQCQVAIKVIKISKTHNNEFQELNQRIQRLLLLNGDRYIQSIVESFYDEQLGLIAIVTELYSSNLDTILKINNFRFDQLVALTYQLLNNLIAIQQNDIAHGDLKSHNIFYSKSTNQFLIEIVDDTFLYDLNTKNTQQTQESLQDNTLKQSPEVENKQNSSFIYKDVFSIGILLTQALIQRKLTPFESMRLQVQNIFEVLSFLESSIHIKFIKKIICKMLQPNVNERPQPQVLLQKLQKYNINENSLRLLKLKKELKKLVIQKYNNKYFKQVADYDVLEIDFLRNFIDQKQVSNLCLELAQCTNISILIISLSEHKIGDQGAQNLGKGLENCINIKTLTLQLWENNISDQGLQHLGSGIAKCTYLQNLTLYLMINRFGDKGVQHLGLELAKCQYIQNTILHFQGNKIGNQGIQNLTIELGKFRHLQVLKFYFQSNNIKQEGVLNLFIELQKCLRLQTLVLDLSNIGINSYESHNLFSRLANLVNLLSLELVLRQNQIDNQIALNLATELLKCRKLSSLNLDLSFNYMIDQGEFQLVSELAKSLKLSSLILNLQSNGFRQISKQKFTNHVIKMKRLVFQNVEY